MLILKRVCPKGFGFCCFFSLSNVISFTFKCDLILFLNGVTIYFLYSYYCIIYVCVEGVCTLLSGLPRFLPVNPVGDGVWLDSWVEPNEISVRIWNFAENVGRSFYVIFRVFVTSVFAEKIVKATV